MIDYEAGCYIIIFMMFFALGMYLIFEAIDIND